MRARFENIYRTYRDTVYNYLYYMCREEELAEDLAQETFLKIFQGLRRFRGDCSEKTWCLTVARNTFLSYARKRQPLLLGGELPAERNKSFGSPLEEQVIRREEGALVRRVLSALKEEERTILLLRDCEGIAYEELSRLLGITEANVKVRLHRARKKYRERYLRERERMED